MSKVMLVTGGSRGIGAATAVLAAQRGYAVCVNYVGNRTAADGVVATIEKAGGKAIAVGADVASESDVIRLFETVDRTLGRVDALVNNAAILDVQSRLENLNAARLNRILATNVTGAFLCAREAVRRMSTKHGGAGGAIVNVSSAAARLGSAGEYVDYAASKGAIDTMTLGLSKEVATEGIRVNVVSPGVIATDLQDRVTSPEQLRATALQIPMRRIGAPDECTGAFLYLCSDKLCGYVTGQVIEVNGGLLMP